jgi:uncharacterized protein (TIGR03435 family)
MYTKRLTIVLYIAASALGLFALSPHDATAQSPQPASPHFEVTSVKQNRSQSDTSKIDSKIPDRFAATDMPVLFLILYAYDLPGHQLIGAPEWTRDQAFDVIGTYPTVQPTNSDIRIMLQNLLAERFGLKVHREQRPIPSYDLVLARKDGRLGPQLLKSNVDCTAWKALNHSRIDAGGPSPVSPSGKRPECMMLTNRKFMTGGAITIHDLTADLGAIVDKPIIDKTGLTAAYDIDLQWDPTGMYADRPSDALSTQAPSGPSIFTAIEEQLGLKLIPQKEKFDVLVVDQIKPPDPN